MKSFQNSLIGKPKLFLIDACRGKIEMKAATVSMLAAESTTSEIPTHSDILISYSTVEDFVSYTSESNPMSNINSFKSIVNDKITLYLYRTLL